MAVQLIIIIKEYDLYMNHIQNIWPKFRSGQNWEHQCSFHLLITHFPFATYWRKIASRDL